MKKESKFNIEHEDVTAVLKAGLEALGYEVPKGDLDWRSGYDMVDGERISYLVLVVDESTQLHNVDAEVEVEYIEGGTLQS